MRSCLRQRVEIRYSTLGAPHFYTGKLGTIVGLTEFGNLEVRIDGMPSHRTYVYAACDLFPVKNHVRVPSSARPYSCGALLV